MEPTLSTPAGGSETTAADWLTFVIDHKRTDWHVIDEPAAVAGAGHIGDVPLLASEPNRPKTGR